MAQDKSKDEDVLVLEDKKEKTLGVVSEIDKKTGKVETVEPKDENKEKFLKINLKDSLLKNFMGNFLRQYNDPSHFGLYKIANDKVEQSVAALAEILKNPKAKENVGALEGIEVKFDEFTPTKEFTPIDESRIDKQQFENIGVDFDLLKDSGELEKMLKWQKTDNLIPIRVSAGEATIYTEARLALRENAEGNINVAIHAIRKEPELGRPYMGVKFTEDDKENLLKTGNLGRIVELTPSNGDSFNAFVSVDKLTNELLAVRSDRIRIPDEILGAKLSDEQKEKLAEGKGVLVEGMKSKQGNEFRATMQVNADKKGLEFIFNVDQKRNLKQKQNNGEKYIPKKFCGIEITDKQHAALDKGEVLYLKEMTNRKGETFNAYIKYSDGHGRLRFTEHHPDKKKEKVVAVAEESKTQQAVDNDGKTNEATKNVKEPLKKGQTEPTENQKKEEKKEEQKKSKGRRM